MSQEHTDALHIRHAWRLMSVAVWARDAPGHCCRVCPFMLRALHYALAKAQALQPDWLALRVSYGMNGVLLRVHKPLNPRLSLHLSAALPPLAGAAGVVRHERRPAAGAQNPRP
jgi:hypothetical protein